MRKHARTRGVWEHAPPEKFLKVGAPHPHNFRDKCPTDDCEVSPELTQYLFVSVNFVVLIDHLMDSAGHWFFCVVLYCALF